MIRAQYTTTTPAFTLSTTPDNGTALPSTDPSAYGGRPLAVMLQAEAQNIRWTDDGSTPTASVGMVLPAGASMVYRGELTTLKFIRTTAGAILNVNYFADGDTSPGTISSSSSATLSGVLPAALGQTTMSASLPVTMASDQTAVLADVKGTIFAAGPITSNVITRPSDTTQYSIGDLVANSVTAGSVTPFTFANAVSVSAGVAQIARMRIQKSTTGLTNASFRVHIYNAAPTSLANGDNGAWSTAIAGYIGAFDVTVDRAFTDGASGAGVPLTGNSILLKVASGTTLYALIEARAAYTPGNAETFTIISEVLRW